MLGYFWNRIIKKLRGKAIINSNIHKTSKVEAGSTVINSNMNRYSFCGYDCKIINCNIGAFCSIADNVIIGNAEHPITWVSTSPVFYKGRDSVKKKFSEFTRAADKKTYISNDVWIGAGAQIKSGVSIGTGAIIGMGSIVTNDVAPYAIVGGVPATLLRMRFEPGVCEDLLRSEWWTFDDEKLKYYASFIQDPKIFINEVNK